MVFTDAEYPTLRARLLAWASGFAQAAVLDSCGSADTYGAWRLLVAVRQDAATLPAEACVPGAWYFGGIGYAYGQVIEPQLPKPRKATVPFAPTCFFRAETVLGIPRDHNRVLLLAGRMPDLPPAPLGARVPLSLPLTDLMDKALYRERFAQVREAIRTGEVYELNLCRELTACVPQLDSLALWEQLILRSPVPMAAYLRMGEEFVLMSASPERFLLHRDRLLVTQPIKGTARRLPDAPSDTRQLHALQADAKARAENLMIADLARNDLGRSCVPGTITALTCQPLTLSTLHHLVSTVLGIRSPEVTPWEAIRATFPPGSMTGAPKVRAQELIHALEPRDRGLYSGAAGYIAPNQDFDFNVVIRSYVYNPMQGALSTHVGGAITWDSDMEAEFAETETKAMALRFE
ncbi:MAG: anthranilate synthase component I family protein [Bacteroidetes bacterium]|nr:anthranilate synthase component I family protein [Bacteroidota bacterium]